jgi:hypothetical protein
MQTWPTAPIPSSILGWIIALLVLIIDIVLLVIGQMDLRLGLLIGGCALSRLL